MSRAGFIILGYIKTDSPLSTCFQSSVQCLDSKIDTFDVKVVKMGKKSRASVPFERLTKPIVLAKPLTFDNLEKQDWCE